MGWRSRESTSTFELGNISVELTRKRIKNVHLRVFPPHGNVRMSAPIHMSMTSIHAVASSKLEWIKMKQQKMRDQDHPEKALYVSGEQHLVWGASYPLRVVERESAPNIELEDGVLTLQIRPGADMTKRQAIISKWYREAVRDALPPLIRKWEPVMEVQVSRFFVQRMKTRWGSCNLTAESIRLNSELAKRHPNSLEYIVVHEMAHLLEPSHNLRFKSLMDSFLPDWRDHRRELNHPPAQDGPQVFL